MKRLLWSALFVRVLLEQKKLFATAILTVSLGVALALGIRLGTQSALNSLEQNVGKSEKSGWSDPYAATTAEAKLFLRESVSRFGGRLFTSIEAISLADNQENSRSTTFLVNVYWGGESNPESGTTLDTDSGGEPGWQMPVPTAAAPVRSNGIAVFVNRNCAKTLPQQMLLLVSGKKVPFILKPLNSDIPAQNCLQLAADSNAFSKPEFAQLLHSAPLFAIFPTQQTEQKIANEQLQTLAAQIPGLEISSHRNRISRLEEVTASFRTNLQLMGFIALFIGFAIVHHVFSLLIARQSRSLAVLSALGIAQRRQILVLLCLAAFLGLAASLVGILLGLIAGGFLSGVTSSTIKNLYDNFVDASSLYWTKTDLIYGFLLGFSACLLGALHPIFKLKKLPVAQVMRDGSFESHDTGLNPRQSLLITSALIVVSLGCLSWAWVWNRIPVTALLACLGFLISTALLAQQMGYLLYQKLNLHSWRSRWTTQLRIFLAPQAAVVLQVLTLTFTLTFGVKGMAESFRATLSDWSQDTLKADLWIRTVGGAAAPLPETVIQRLQVLPESEVVAIDRLSIGPASLMLQTGATPKPILLAAARFAEQSKVAPMRILEPEAQSAAAQSETAARIYKNSMSCAGSREDPCEAYISEPIAVHFGLEQPLGQTLCPTIKSQTLCFRVASVYQDFGSDQGVILTDEAVFKRLLENPPLPSFSNIYLRDPTSAESAKLNQELRAIAENSEGTLAFETLNDLRSRILQTFDNTFRVTDALYILCGIIAVIATVSCLNLQIRLRGREWSLQWALGIGSQTLLRRFSLWSALIALLASSVSLLGGWILSAVLVYVVNYYSFGYSLSLAIPWSLPITVISVATLSGYVSGWLQKKSLLENTTLSSLARE